MRGHVPAATLLTMAVSGLVLAGCVDNSATTSPSAGATAPPASTGASTGTGAPVAGCVTGAWRSTAVSAQAASGSTSANFSGGSGVAVTVGANGETVIDFSTMRPVDFTTTALGSQVSGNFTFSGQVSGTVQTGTASPTATPGPSGTTATATAAGTWEPVPPVNWGNTRVTVDLLEPVKVRPVDNVRIADYVGDGANRTGNVVNIEPLLGKGRYQCQGDNLVLTPQDGGMSWTLTRA
jgi:hypothetical protein